MATLKVVNPATGKLAATLPADDAKSVRAKYERARAADFDVRSDQLRPSTRMGADLAPRRRGSHCLSALVACRDPPRVATVISVADRDMRRRHARLVTNPLFYGVKKERDQSQIVSTPS